MLKKVISAAVLAALLVLGYASAVPLSVMAAPVSQAADLPRFREAEALPLGFVPLAARGDLIFGEDYYSILDGDPNPYVTIVAVWADGTNDIIYQMEEPSRLLGVSPGATTFVGTYYHVSTGWTGFINRWGQISGAGVDLVPQAASDNGLVAGLQASRVIYLQYSDQGFKIYGPHMEATTNRVIAVPNDANVVVQTANGLEVWQNYEQGNDLRLVVPGFYARQVSGNGGAVVGMSGGVQTLFRDGTLVKYGVGEFSGLSSRFITGFSVIPIGRQGSTYANVGVIASARTRRVHVTPIASLVTNARKGWTYTNVPFAGDTFVVAERFFGGSRLKPPYSVPVVLVPVKPAR